MMRRWSPSRTPADTSTTTSTVHLLPNRRIDQPVTFPFAWGLGYTTWDDLTISAPGEAGPDQELTVICTAHNTGGRAGRTLVTLWMHDPLPGPGRPPRWLVGFGHLAAEPGERGRVEIVVPARAWQQWDLRSSSWWSPGRDLRLVGEVCGGDPATAGIHIQEAR